MKVIAVISFFLVMVGCDTIPVRPAVDSCVEHWWIKGIYKMQSVDDLNVKLKNISGGEDRVISQFDRGWSEVVCPKNQ